MTAQSLAQLQPSEATKPDGRNAVDLLHEVERLRTQLRDLVTHLEDASSSDPSSGADGRNQTQITGGPAGGRDRLYIAEQVTHRLDWLRRDAWDLERLLQGETLSPLFHDSLCEVIKSLQRIAKKASPHASEQADAA